MLIDGGLNDNRWRRGYKEWLWREELSALANPPQPTHRSGTVGGTILPASGPSVLKGVPPVDSETEKEAEEQ